MTQVRVVSHGTDISQTRFLLKVRTWIRVSVKGRNDGQAISVPLGC